MSTFAIGDAVTLTRAAASACLCARTFMGGRSVLRCSDKSFEETFVSLIRLFDGSSYFDGLADETRKEYPWKLKKIEEKWGSVPVAVFSDPDAAGGTAATLLAEAGATEAEIAEAMCWTVENAKKMLDTYLARRGVLAASAYRKLEKHRGLQTGLQTELDLDG
jgi:hypothetical protein